LLHRFHRLPLLNSCSFYGSGRQAYSLAALPVEACHMGVSIALQPSNIKLQSGNNRVLSVGQTDEKWLQRLEKTPYQEFWFIFSKNFL